MSKTCDVAIIGAGISGLTAAGLLSSSGLEVVVLEEQPRPGGCLQGFSRAGVTFDTAIHWLNGLGPNGLVSRVMGAVHDEWPRCKPLSRIWRYRSDSFDHLLTDEPDLLCESLAETWPEDRAGFERFFRDCRSLGKRMSQLYGRMRGTETMGLLTKTGYGLKMLAWYLPVRRLLRAPIEKGLNHYFTGEGPARFFCAEENLSSAVVPIAWAYERDFFAPPAGGSQAWIAWLAERLNDYGGELRLNSPVKKVRVNTRRSAGVELEDGSRIDSHYVIAACDIHRLYHRMMDKGSVPKRMKEKLENADRYYSCLMLYCTLDRPAETLGLGEEMVRLTRDDVPRCEQERGGPDRAALLVHAPSVRDPSLAPPGKGTLCIQVPAWLEDHDRWRTGPDLERGPAYRELKAEITERILERVDRTLAPGLKKHITRVETATPVTFKRYTANRDGCIMTHRPTTRNIRARLAHQRTKIPNLFLAGHWADYGGGIPIAIKTAANAALLILQQTDRNAAARVCDLLEGR